MEELRRRMASAKAWGIDDARLVTPTEVKELVPYIDESIILGGFYCPTVSVVDSLRAGTIMRERGLESGRLAVFPGTEVTAMDVERGRIRRVHTLARRDRGRDGRDRLWRLEPDAGEARRAPASRSSRWCTR